jgi:hypothetical protein
MQLVGARERIVTGERIRQGRYRLVQQMEDHMLNRPPQRLRQSLDLLPGRSGKRTRRSLTNSPRIGKLLSRERGLLIPRAGVSPDTPSGHASPDLTPKPPQLSFQRIQLSPRDADHLRCLDAHTQLLASALACQSLGGRRREQGEPCSVCYYVGSRKLAPCPAYLRRGMTDATGDGRQQRGHGTGDRVGRRVAASLSGPGHQRR